MPESATIAFDVYGTLIDPLGIRTTLGSYVGERAADFAQAWREKQLEYTFRRALMRDYRDFTVCTRDALQFVNLRLGAGLPAGVRDLLMERYRLLPAYADAADALASLRNAGHRVFAFSNGHPGDLECLLGNAALTGHLDGIVSVHGTASYKPDPAVYRHFLECAGTSPAGTWLVSGNPFDVIGAHAVGWKTAWVKRDPAAVFDPWGIEPTVTISDLREMSRAV